MWPWSSKPNGSTASSQARSRQFSLIPGEDHLTMPARSDVRDFLPNSYFLPPWHSGWRGAGWVNLPWPVQFVRQWRAYYFPRRPVSPLTQTTWPLEPRPASQRWLSATRLVSTLAERMKDLDKRLEKHRDALHSLAHRAALTSSAVRGANLMASTAR